MTPALDTLVMRAAVTGAFDPVTLFEAIPDDVARDLAGRLALLCDEAPGGTCWVLQPAARREALARLDRPAMVEAALDGAPEAAAADHFTLALRCLLKQQSLPPLQTD